MLRAKGGLATNRAEVYWDYSTLGWNRPAVFETFGLSPLDRTESMRESTLYIVSRERHVLTEVSKAAAILARAQHEDESWVVEF